MQQFVSYIEPQKLNQQVQKQEDIIPIFDMTEFNSISTAFIHVTSTVSKLIQRENFYPIRRSCIEQMHTPNGAQLSPDVVQKIKVANNLDALLDILVDTPYWSWIDLRLLEAMVAASGSSVAKSLLSSYKNSVFSKKVTEVLPSVPNREIRDAYYSKIISKINKDIEKITVSDLLQFQTQLQTVIMDIKSGTCTLAQIEQGCIEIHWFIPTHCVYHAYKSACLKRHKFHMIELQSLQIGSYSKIYDLSISEAETVDPPLPVSVGKMHNLVMKYIYTYAYIHRFNVKYVRMYH